MRWEKPPVDHESVRLLAERFGIDLLSAAILVRRGVTSPAEMPYYLEADLRYLHDPYLFPDMPDVVERILQAREEGEHVLVFGDRDADGITSTAVMVRTLRELGVSVDWEVPEGDAPYGLSIEAIERFAARDGSLIVTVDCGVTNIAEIAHAVELGIDTIVIDHHNPHDELPPAVAIIDPKVGDEYPFQGLCGCALAAKVRQAIAKAGTELYGEATTLITARPGNGVVIVDAVQIEYGIEVDRTTEALVPGVARLEGSRLAPFLVGRALVCYDAPLVHRLLAEALGRHVEIHLTDLAAEVARAFPPLAGRSLLEMREGSRLARYQEGETEEIDVLAALYRAVVDARYPTVRTALEEVLDLVALATLADMMPIVDENRTLVKLGMARLNGNASDGMRALIGACGVADRTLVSRDIGWTLAPVINASGRMGSPSLAVRLLLSDDPTERAELAREVHALNAQRKHVGNEAWRAVLPQAQGSLDRLDGKMIAVHEPKVHRGVTGIIAGRLSRRFGVPSAVVTTVDGMAVGSVRSARGFVATTFLQRLEDLLDRWGGHNEAAGFNLAVDRIDELLARIEGIIPEVELSVEDDALVIDAELPPKYLSEALEETVRLFEPYGHGNPPLHFLARNLHLDDAQLLGKDQEHLKLLFSGLPGGGNGHSPPPRWPAVYWNAADRLRRDFDVRDRVDVVFEFTRNWYNGSSTIQLVVLDLARSEHQVA